MRKLAAVLAVAALALAACSGSDPPAGTGPLGNDSGGGDCAVFHRGQVITYGGVPLTNTLHRSIRTTGAWLTGARDVRTDAVWAYLISGSTGAWYSLWSHGGPPRSLRHPVSGVVVPPGESAQFLIVATVRSSKAYVAGADLGYSYGGKPYVLQTNWFAGMATGCR